MLHACPAVAPATPDLSGWESRALSAVWIGHATVLIRIGGMTILTDPVFSDRIGLCGGIATIGPRRMVQPALSMRQLPKIDLILVSHAHFDHLDRPTLRQLSRTAPVITSPNNSDLIRDLGFRQLRELHPNNAVRIGGSTITAVAVKHWGPRMFVDHQRGYAAFVIESKHHRVLFGGDTADGPHFDHLHNREIDLAMLGIGAYNPYVAAHATPEQAWDMFRRMNARWLLPMHHSTFRLSHEEPEEPLRRLLVAAADRPEAVVVSKIGGQWTAG